MLLRNALTCARRLDKQWQRWCSPVRRVLVDSRSPMNVAVIAPVYEAMRDDPRVQFYWTASAEHTRASEIYADAGLAGHVVSPARAWLMRFDAYLTADVLWLALPRGSRRVMMFHGVAGKYAGVYDTPVESMRHWDRLFFINRRRLRNYVRSGAIDPDSPAARLVGYPKVDCLVSGALARDAVLRALGLDVDRPVVLYAPTWTPYSSLDAMGEDLVHRLCASRHTVIVKLHDRSREGTDWAARLEPLLRQHGGHFARSSDACPYLAAADVLITDHSSVGFEYLLLDRPLIRIEMAELIAATNIPPGYVDMMTEAAHTVKTSAGVTAAVEEALAEPARRSAARRAVAEELFYQPGTATLRAAQELYEVLELDPPADLPLRTRWPAYDVQWNPAPPPG
jgi:hypothetical protein